MIEIKNKTNGPIQLLIKSKTNKGLTCLNLPGIGASKNIYLLEDERHTEYVDRAEKAGFISQKRITKKGNKGE